MFLSYLESQMVNFIPSAVLFVCLVLIFSQSNIQVTSKFMEH